MAERQDRPLDGLLERQRVTGTFRGGAGRLGRGRQGGVADGVLDLDGVAQAGGAAVTIERKGSQR